MEKFGKSQAVRRVEDVRFLTGEGRYVDDIAPDGALHAYVFRSPVAHAVITGLNTDDAKAADGVHLVLTAADLQDAGLTMDIKASLIRNRDGSKGAGPKRPLLATDRVRFVGEPVAVVVADTVEQAKDAAELIEFDFDELDAHVTVAPGGPDLHPEALENVAFDYGKGDLNAVEEAFANAAHVVEAQIDDNRVIVSSMEPRGCWAEWTNGRLHLCVNGQGVWDQKDGLVNVFGLQPDDIRVTNPDVGGGFGMKAMTYPEYYIIPQAARMLGRPVRWMSERTEAMLSDNAGRDLTSTVALAFDADHKITAYRVDTLCNLGAYNSELGQFIQTDLFAKVLMGTYDVQTTWLGVKGIFTNTTQVDAYRGAGRPEAIYALERAIDYAARQLGVDPWELRRKNFIRPDQFPYKTATGELYDVGDFARVLTRVEAEADKAGFPARKAQSKAQGKLRGLGLCYYIESILGSPTEDAKVTFNDDGTASIYVGTQSNGQGHETVFAQFLSDQTGIPADKISVIQGDSDLIATGGGTGGSRSVTVQSMATLATVDKMITGFTDFLAEDQDVDPNAISFDDERFRIDGSNLTPTMLEVADMARAAGHADLLSFAAQTTLPGRSYPNGAHVAEIEIDPDTGVVEVVKYTVTDDFGNLINPMLAEGQVHGGVAQGIGQAITEHVVYDPDGQLLTASFMDYGLPRANDMPMVTFYSEPVPSTQNPMGMKGCGEAGTVGALAAVANAVLDAVWDEGIYKVDMPFTPNRVWTILQEAKGAAA
ncbi:xanthine dehydrogenase family protein molybdopterin-binding subunit [Pseudaestuariivita rosea]|uniref:xanthine dehydrogenase family protein molybdopterin-binding subunit n=1 Tax=Pseudaestuariivita rosea TaxID=2763263 RepID=UPI001ABBA235|nr:xanthine dehydrogenase family protein molybdopterin-binding subunit [Pseudaestuariivita rosea]